MNPRAFDASELPDPMESFRGVTRLFPLPNLVLFPGVLVPLHIFEPRYRQMVADAMESDRLITMVLLKKGPVEEYEDSAPIYDTGCLGHILHHEFLPDGRSNLILRGLCRVRLDTEEPSDRLYRTARVTVLEDRYGEDTPATLIPQRGALHEMLQEILSLSGRSRDVQKLEAMNQMPLGNYCDLLCHWLGLEAAVKQTLLAEVQVSARADTLQAWMQAMLETLRRREDSTGSGRAFSQN